MSRGSWKRMAVWMALSAMAHLAQAQSYVGFVYPAGGRQGTTFTVTLGGQQLEGVDSLLVSGTGVTARVVEYNKRMSPQEIRLISEQVGELKNPPSKVIDPAHTNLIARIERLVRDHVDQPACASIANLLVAEVTIARNAPAGRREIRVRTPRGLSNPLVFEVGELPEIAAPPVPTSRLSVLGKEAASLRRKTREADAGAATDPMMMAMMATVGPSGAPGALDDDVVRIQLPCTVNGQITSGTVDRYRFAARKGQRLVINVRARELVPFMADAVPGWFQPVIALWDARGREVAYKDDDRFKPDPVVIFDVPEDGEYLFAIYDAIYRGREDFVYRVSVGELPFITSIFPLGARAGSAVQVAVQGANLSERSISLPASDSATPGTTTLGLRGRGGLLANRVPFAFDSLPECLEKEGNDTARKAQPLELPVIVNGRVSKPDDVDFFQFQGCAGDTVVAEVTARRLDSPLDSVLQLTDAGGRCLALNDDREDVGAGINTHHADSYLRVTLPSNGVYRIRLADTQHNGGEEYAYRLRVSAPQADFALRVVPSSLVIRGNAPAYPSVHLIRHDGFAGPITLTLKDAPSGISMRPVTMSGTQAVVRVEVKKDSWVGHDPFRLAIVGTATNQGAMIVRPAVPAEDRMQAFLWRHLVPAQELMAVVPAPKPEPVAAGRTATGSARTP